MKEKLDTKSVKFVQDTDLAISVLYEVSKWLVETDKNPTEWWLPVNMNKEYLLNHAEPEEFYVAMVGGKPAAAAILQDNERNQSWESVDKSNKQTALYVHWLAVAREFAGKGLPKIILDFAQGEAKKRGFTYLRLDTSAKKMELRKIYEDLGFPLAGVYDGVVYYQKKL